MLQGDCVKPPSVVCDSCCLSCCRWWYCSSSFMLWVWTSCSDPQCCRLFSPFFVCVTVLSQEVTLFFHILLCLSNAYSHSVGGTLLRPLQPHRRATVTPCNPTMSNSIMLNIHKNNILEYLKQQCVYSVLKKIQIKAHNIIFQYGLIQTLSHLWMLSNADCWVARVQWLSSVFKKKKAVVV